MSSTIKPALGWLHISDLHFLSRTSWRDSQPLKMLKKDLSVLLQEGIRIDLVLCTGDIGFGETKSEPLSEQYANAKEFFNEILDICQIDSSRLFLVPGNHDIDRSKVRESQTEWFRSDRRNVQQINQNFSDSHTEIQGAMERLSHYRQFINDNYPHICLDQNVSFGAYIEINGISVSISGLNSAWTCADNDDKNQIWLAGETQLHACAKAISGQSEGAQPHLRLAMLHHPQDWLHPTEAQDLRGRLQQDFDFLLHGHAHDQWISELTRPQHVVIAAGAATGESQQEFGYNVVQIAAERTSVHLRRYDSKGGGWIDENVHGRTKHGVWSLKPLAHFPTHSPQVVPAPVQPPQNLSSLTPLSRGHYGLENALDECSRRLEKSRLLAVFGMAGVGKSVLVGELYLRPQWQALRLLQMTVREGGGVIDFFGQLAPHLGIHDERPHPPTGDTVAKIVEELHKVAPSVQPFFLHIQRAHHWFQRGHWQDEALSRLLQGISRAYPECFIVLETREQTESGLISYEVTGLHKQFLADYLANPPGLSTGWTLTQNERKYVFSRLGGGHGRGAHAYGLSLLVRLAAEKCTSPYSILKQYPDVYAQELYDKLFRDLYENILTKEERELLYACSLYRDGLHYSHLSRLEAFLPATDSGVALIRRRLLAENADWLYLHDLAAEQARNLAPDESRTRELHQVIAEYWLAELRGQKALMDANVRRALEALYHLEQSGQGERVAEISPNLFGRSPEETLKTLWNMNNRYFNAHQDEKIRVVLEYILKVDPTNHRAMRFLGECRRRFFGSRDSEALELFIQATDLHPNYPQYWANYGHAAIASEKTEIISTFLTKVANAPEKAKDDHVVAIYAAALEEVERDDEAARLRIDKIDSGSRDATFYADHAKWLLGKKHDAPGALRVLDLARRLGCNNDFTDAIYANALEASSRGGEAAILRQEKINAGSKCTVFYYDHAQWLLDHQHDAVAALKVLTLALERRLADKGIMAIHARALQSVETQNG